MDLSLYKNVSFDGLNYHYYYHPAKSASHPTLLFLHGFPSTSEDWVHQAVYFSNKGYGVIAPDMLGYGGTSKPSDLTPYEGTTLATHCKGILDAEGIQKFVTISHDWGCRVGSMLANLWPERHLASVFISVAYGPPDPNPNAELRIQMAKEKFGLDLFSYWKFFASEESPRLLSEHPESVYSLLFTSQNMLWRTNLSPEGELKKWLLEDKRAPVAAWAPEKDKFIEGFAAGGWLAPTNWYRAMMQGTMNINDKAISKERYTLTHPVLQVATLRDPICIPEIAKHATPAMCTNSTVRDIEAGHWVMLEKPNELNAIIDEYLGSL